MNILLRFLLILSLHDRVGESRKKELNDVFEQCKLSLTKNETMRTIISMWKEILNKNDNFRKENNLFILKILNDVFKEAIGLINTEADEIIAEMKQELITLIQYTEDGNRWELPIECMLQGTIKPYDSVMKSACQEHYVDGSRDDVIITRKILAMSFPCPDCGGTDQSIGLDFFGEDVIKLAFHCSKCSRTHITKFLDPRALSSHLESNGVCKGWTSLEKLGTLK